MVTAQEGRGGPGDEDWPQSSVVLLDGLYEAPGRLPDALGSVAMAIMDAAGRTVRVTVTVQ